jgi:type I restriction enzyme M protein
MYTLPHEIKDLNRMIEILGRRHNYVTVFDDYLSSLVNFFTPPNQHGFGTECFKKYDDKERVIFSDMLKETVRVYNQMITSEDNSWYDLFGELYMFLSSKGKAQALGQFFTPVHLVNMMVQLTYDKSMTGQGLKISDPTCGSGRTLIAFHAHCPGNYVFGEDIDLICCKMSLINFLFHGCEGEVVWHDSLLMDFRKAWRVNPNIRITGLPSIVEITQEQSLICYNGNLNDKPAEKSKVESTPLKLPSEEVNDKNNIPVMQLSLF